jgi:sulfite exporter TauE/SafE
MNGPLLLSATVMGLVGSAHCVVMCGGVVGMTCSAVPAERRGRLFAQLPTVLAYNAGRIVSYALAGAVAGALGSTLASIGLVGSGQVALQLVAGVLMIAVGFHVAGPGRALKWLERAGAPVWRRVQPLARRLVPVRTPWAALGLGLLWGWMPCGLVYAALAGAVTSGSAVGGAATMAAFGAGTLPTLVAMGSAAGAVARAARIGWIRTAAGIALVAFGCFQVSHVGYAWAGSRGEHTCCAHHAGE